MAPTLLVILISWLVASLLLALGGRAQRRESAASITRLVGLAIGLGAFAPLQIAGLRIAGVLPWDSSEAAPLDPFVVGRCVLAAALVLTICIKYLGPVGRLLGQGRTLPRLEDADALATIDDLAARTGAPRPVAYLLPSATPGVTANAAIAGLLAPVLLVTPSALELRPVEHRDAILAHEFGHAKRGTTLRYLLATCIALTALNLLSAWLDTHLFVVAICSLPILFLARRVPGHREELACDRTAAEVVGLSATLAMLPRVHAPLRAAFGERLEPWLHGVAGHPTLAVRRASLLDRFSDGTRGTEDERRAASRDRIYAAVVLAGWVGTLVAAMALGTSGSNLLTGTVLALLGAFGPLALLVGPILSPLRIAARLGLWHVPRGPRIAITRGLLALALLMIVSPAGRAVLDSSDAAEWLHWICLGAAITLLLSIALPSRRGRYERRAFGLVRDGRWPELLSLITEELPERERVRSHSLRLESQARWHLGQRDTARQLLKTRLQDDPNDQAARFQLAMLLGAKDPEGALELLDAVRSACGYDRFDEVSRASLLIHAGRLEAGERVLTRHLQDKPSPDAIAIQARLFAERGEHDAAERQLEQARAAGPDSPILELVATRVALLAGDVELATQRHRRATELCAAHPQHFAEDALDILAAQIAAAQTEAAQALPESGPRPGE